MVVEKDELLDASCLGTAPLPQDAPRVRLDLPRMDDVADLVFLANRKSVAEHLTRLPHPFTLDNARAVVAGAENPARNAATFAIRLKATGRLIGMARHASLEADGAVHVGYWVGEPFWGNGYATEALHALVDHAFNYTNVDELTGACRVTNPASRRVLVKSGFQYRDQSMMRSVGAGGSVPIERYALDRTVWASLKAWGKSA